jgi:HK97 gp10 family phage protein
MGIKVEGMDQIFGEIQKMAKEQQKKESKALKAGARPLAESMKQHVSQSAKHQKHIKEDIQVGSVKEKDGTRFVEVGPGKMTNWRAKFIEYGTARMRPHPFMHPAQMESKEKVLRAIESVMRHGFNK